MRITFIGMLFFSLIACASNIKLPYDRVEYRPETEGVDLPVILSPPNAVYVKSMRERIPEEVYSGKTELDTITAVTGYVHGLWKHNGWNEPAKSDPLSILDEAKSGKNFRCVEYAIVAAGFLNALGVPARVVGLRTYDMETRRTGAGHVVAECYSRTLGKWIMLDAQENVVPLGGGIPLSCVELQQAIFRRDAGLSVEAGYMAWIKAYLYYMEIAVDQRYENKARVERLMLVPVDAKNPTVFQRTNPLSDRIFTNSLSDFYRPPVIAD